MLDTFSGALPIAGPALLLIATFFIFAAGLHAPDDPASPTDKQR